jgi:hypothetical protein
VKVAAIALSFRAVINGYRSVKYGEIIQAEYIIQNLGFMLEKISEITGIKDRGIVAATAFVILARTLGAEIQFYITTQALVVKS